MAKTKRAFIFATFITSGIAVILSFVALGTQAWVIADVSLEGRYSHVKYGLFGGTFERVVSTIVSHEIIMTCKFSDNACAMLCGDTSEDRETELTKLINNEVVSFNVGCPQVQRMFVTPNRYLEVTGRSDGEREFINAGLWVTTILFLVISCLAGVISTGLSVWNTAANPIEIWFNIFGLYIYNGIACGCSLLVVVLWGAQFGATLVNNPCILETITSAGSAGSTELGYSYWLNIVAFVLYGMSIVLLAVRQYLINAEPEEKIDFEENNDSIILF